MKVREYFYTLKVCGFRWFVWFIPLCIVIPLMQQFGNIKLFDDKKVNAVRLGNSGLFLIFSQETQDKIRENVNKSREFDKIAEKERLKKKLEKLEK